MIAAGHGVDFSAPKYNSYGARLTMPMASSGKRLKSGRTHGEHTRFMPELDPQFVGRAEQLEQIATWVDEGASSVLAIINMAGMGKISGTSNGL